jgi:hypothetical protein
MISGPWRGGPNYSGNLALTSASVAPGSVTA